MDINGGGENSPMEEMTPSMRLGTGGQYIFIMPDIDMVIVMTSSFYLEDLSYILDVINTYLLDSVFGSPTN